MQDRLFTACQCELRLMVSQVVEGVKVGLKGVFCCLSCGFLWPLGSWSTSVQSVLPRIPGRRTNVACGGLCDRVEGSSRNERIGGKREN